MITETCAGTLDRGVDWLRGCRDYIRAADVLAVAPVFPGSQKLEFFFRSKTKYRGSWLPAAETKILNDGEEIVANLSISAANGARKWCFVVNKFLPITKRLPDLAEDRITSAVKIDDGKSFLLMTDDFNVWEHIIASAKSLGLILFPDLRWYVVYVKADLARFPRDISGRTLNMQIYRRRLTILELAFAIDGTTLGTIGAREYAW